ncbi:unnamed protein product [Effrenium voratum]|nr:unnamed protein product [Effrenium voratum]
MSIIYCTDGEKMCVKFVKSGDMVEMSAMQDILPTADELSILKKDELYAFLRHAGMSISRGAKKDNMANQILENWSKICVRIADSKKLGHVSETGTGRNDGFRKLWGNYWGYVIDYMGTDTPHVRTDSGVYMVDSEFLQENNCLIIRDDKDTDKESNTETNEESDPETDKESNKDANKDEDEEGKKIKLRITVLDNRMGATKPYHMTTLHIDTRLSVLSLLMDIGDKMIEGTSHKKVLKHKGKWLTNHTCSLASLNMEDYDEVKCEVFDEDSQEFKDIMLSKETDKDEGTEKPLKWSTADQATLDLLQKLNNNPMGIKVNPLELRALEDRKNKYDKELESSKSKNMDITFKHIQLNVRTPTTKDVLTLNVATQCGTVSMMFYYNDQHTFRDIALAIKDYNDMDVGNALGNADFTIKYGVSFVEMWEPVASCVSGENPIAMVIPSMRGGAVHTKKGMFEKQKKMQDFKSMADKNASELNITHLQEVSAYNSAEVKIKNFCQSVGNNPNKAIDDLLHTMSIPDIDGALAELSGKGGTDFKVGKASVYFFGLMPLKEIVDNIDRVNDMSKSILMYSIMKINEGGTTTLSDFKKRLERAKFHKIGAQSASSTQPTTGGDVAM